jgi:hypothetical protein
MDRGLPARRTTLARQIWRRQTAAGVETHLNQELTARGLTGAGSSPGGALIRADFWA